MKKYAALFVVMLFLLTSAFTFLPMHEWGIDKGFAVKFKDNFATGGFDSLKGVLVFDENNPAAARFDVTIQVNSIEVGSWLRNHHAKGSSWFDAEKYPYIHFVSTSITKTGTNYLATGILELHGVKKQIIIPFMFIANNGRGTFSGKFKINRTEFGIGEPKGNAKDITDIDVTIPVVAK